MGVNKQAPAYRCGRLQAALHILRLLGTGHSDLALARSVDATADSPETALLKHLALAGLHLHEAAARKDPKRLAAATEVFQALPGLIPPGGVPKGRFRNAKPSEWEFSEGFHAQLCEYRKRFSELLG
ncbi:hypothetical protein [Streptomyces sp. C1-2]|uniref:hypothetical protein n=1 Tax=Streptomyces sp. C1-2 TaxID=2720022 RepID=UPI0014326141|nr:hypothetical protein [Streptomyces sp. C1-2]NJP69684.1 hypothetical protein [Streptomyces sp. C1-2]